MANKAIVDKAISDLTQALQIANEDLFVLEQNGEAKKLKGETLLDFVTLSVVSVTVTTLPAGSSATATYDKSTGTRSASHRATRATPARQVRPAPQTC